MAFNQQLIDGGVASQSRDITVRVGRNNSSVTNIVYHTDDFSFDAASQDLVRTNERNVPDGEVTTAQVPTGSATLQLPDTDTEAPSVLNLFDEDYNGETVTFKIKSVGRRETKGGITTVPITFGACLTTDVVSIDSAGTETTMSGITAWT